MVEALQSQGKTQGERDHQLGKAAEKASHATRCPAALGKRCRKNNKNWLKGSQQNCHSLWKKGKKMETSSQTSHWKNGRRRQTRLWKKKQKHQKNKEKRKMKTRQVEKMTKKQKNT